MVTLPEISFRLWAMLIGILSGGTLSKQALAERIAAAADFLKAALAAVMLSQSGLRPVLSASLLRPFRHAYLEDSTGFTVAPELAALLARLRQTGRLDGWFRLRERKVLVRIVAVRVSQAVADERRRKAYQNRDRRCRPSKYTLTLMDWAIFITNGPAEIWSAEAVVQAYGLRWRRRHFLEQLLAPGGAFA